MRKQLVSFRIEKETYDEVMKLYDIDKELYKNRSDFMRFVFTLGVHQYKKMKEKTIRG